MHQIAKRVPYALNESLSVKHRDIKAYFSSVLKQELDKDDRVKFPPDESLIRTLLQCHTLVRRLSALIRNRSAGAIPAALNAGGLFFHIDGAMSLFNIIDDATRTDEIDRSSRISQAFSLFRTVSYCLDRLSDAQPGTPSDEDFLRWLENIDERNPIDSVVMLYPKTLYDIERFLIDKIPEYFSCCGNEITYNPDASAAPATGSTSDADHVERYRRAATAAGVDFNDLSDDDLRFMFEALAARTLNSPSEDIDADDETYALANEPFVPELPVKFHSEGHFDNFAPLFDVLMGALNQAVDGKGQERHGQGLPFIEQPIISINTILGSADGLAYQVLKKVQEALRMPELARQERELFGAINYTAAIIIWLRLNKKA